MKAGSRGTERHAGFTLIELLVVVVIVGILSAVATPVFLNQRKKTVDASLRADIRALAQAQETWIADNPEQFGTDDRANLPQFKGTRDNIIYVSLHPTRRGYCLIARNVNDTMGGYPYYIMYDSLGGGFLNDGRHWDWAASYPPGAQACGPNRLNAVRVWP